MKDNADEQWPFWVANQPAILDLFCALQPFADDDDDDVAKQWGLDSHLEL